MVSILTYVESVGCDIPLLLGTGFHGDSDIITLGLDKIIELGFQINI